MQGTQVVAPPPDPSSSHSQRYSRRWWLLGAGATALGMALFAGRLAQNRPPRSGSDSEVPKSGSAQNSGSNASPESNPRQDPRNSPSESNPKPEVRNSIWQTTRFEVVTVNATGAILNRQTYQARYFDQSLPGGVALTMLEIPAGEFWMGSPESEADRSSNEGPQRLVRVARFAMGRYPVTQAQYEAVMGTNPSHFKGANRPVEKVSWHDAQEFCRKLSQQTGLAYRLPSEAEWEYACRAGTTTPFYFGPTITTDLANYDGESTYGSGPKGVDRQETTEVGRFPANAFGLHDMHGNVWEWCADPSHGNYQGAPTDGSVWNENADTRYRVLRGGSWDDIPLLCRSAVRLRSVPDDRFRLYGFRPCLSSPGLNTP